MSVRAPQAHEFFVDTWKVYHKIVAGNYMFHRQIYTEVERRLNEYSERPISLLDLGCGEATHIAPVLSKLNLISYHGIDLSEVALDLAARNLASLACHKTFHHADMLEFLQRDTDSYEVIFSSFALHHLTTADKQAFFRACRERLRPEGRFILIDVARDENQDLPAYLDAYCGRMESEWSSLTPEELRFAVTHVRENDLPERVSDLRAMAAEAGFTDFQDIQHHTWHHLFWMLAGT